MLKKINGFNCIRSNGQKEGLICKVAMEQV